MDFDSAAQEDRDREPLAKRARIDAGDTTLSIHSPITGVLEQDGDDADSDFYGEETPQHKQPVKIANGDMCADDSLQNGDRDTSPSGGIPGLLMAVDESGEDEASRQLESEHAANDATTAAVGDVEKPDTAEAAPPLQPQVTAESDAKTTPPTEEEATTIVETIANEDVDMGGADVAVSEEVVKQEDTEEEKEDGEAAEPEDAEEGEVEEVVGGEETGEEVKAEKGEEEGEVPSWMESLLEGPAEKPSKPPPDPEFLAHAAAMKDNENAEWRYDTSDAESSSDSSSDSDSGSEDDSDDEEVTALKPEDIAKVLMQELEEDGASTAAGPLRTKNELPEEAEKVERPDIVVTPEMKIEELGKVESTLDHLVLIKASTSGEFQVLSEGSLLVLEDRSVIGVVADTLGRVEEPLYTVRFNSLEEINELKVEVGKKIFYVPEHSTYVFTKPLLAQKGSDASNLYDEEAAESEQEFSDDEAEAEYKRKKKEARKNAERNKNPDQHKNKKQKTWAPPEPPAPVGPATLNYDEPYVPLQRPANLHELANQPPPPPPSSLRGRGRGGKGDRGDRGDRGGFRGRGNDRGGRGGMRGRGNDRGGRGGNERGRGRGGFDRGGSERGGRGGHGYERGGYEGGRGGHEGGRGGHEGGRGGYDGGRGGGQQGGRGGSGSGRNRSPRAQRDQFRNHGGDESPFNQQQQGQQSSQQQQYPPAPPPPPPVPFPGFPQPQPQQPGQNQQWQLPQFPQFPLPFQFPGMPPIPPPPPPPQAAGALPTGSHVNPNFYGGSQSPPQPAAQIPAWMQAFMQQQQPQQHQPQQQSSGSSDEAFRALQNTLALLKQNQQNQQQQQ
jgi:H/ACA ribonucleoprotein complex non-core subunit NAF1